MVLPIDALITQLQSCFGCSGEVRYPELMFNQPLHIELIGV